MKNDIVDVVSQYVKLNRRGNTYFGLCPFHNDNNPSLVVNPKKNIATCFACGTGGNAISFVQKYEKIVNNNDISFNEAITKVVSEICHLNIDVSHLKKNKYNNKYFVSSRRYTEDEQKLLQLNEKLNIYSISYIFKN